MIYVVDANVIFSALYDMDSNAGRLLLRAVEGQAKLYSTEHVLTEMLDILQRKLGYNEDEANLTVTALPIEWVDIEVYAEELVEAKRHLAHEGDASLLACALLLGCEVVSGDKAVLAARFRNVKVRRLRDAV